MTVALSTLNFRDLGGLPTDDGRAIKPGIIFRSEGPASFFDEHRAELGALGVRRCAICDQTSNAR
jgi:protein-tyrosine phosphatase